MTAKTQRTPMQEGPGHAHGGDDERIYHFRCRCGHVGTRRSRSHLVRLTCRDCGADVAWWQSTPVEAFVPAELAIEISKEQLDAIRTDKWRDLSRKAMCGELAMDPDASPIPSDEHPNAPPGAGAMVGDAPIESVAQLSKCPLCKSTAYRLLASGGRQCTACDAIVDIGDARIAHDEHAHEQLCLLSSGNGDEGKGLH